MRKQKKGFLFESILAFKPKYGRYDLSYRNTMSLAYGKLTPTLCKKVVPGDRFKIDTSALVKSLPMVAPSLTEIDLYVDTFFVPMRLVLGDSAFDKYMNGEINLPSLLPNLMVGSDLVTLGRPDRYLHYIGMPYVPAGSNPPVEVVNSFKKLDPITKVPLMSIYKIWNDYYRDQWIEDEIDLDSIRSTQDTAVVNKNLFSVKYPKDYYTSALPFAQAGEPVSLPLGSTAPVVYKANPAQGGPGSTVKRTTDAQASSGPLQSSNGALTDQSGAPVIIDNAKNLEVDLTNATSATIQQLRIAYRLQEFLERRARGGGRAPEIILNMFGIVVPDYRMQRPEYIGGSRTPISINSITQVSSTNETSPQGTQTGNAIGVSRTRTKNGFYQFKEPGYVIQFAYILARQSYFQGIDRNLFVTNYLDEYWPSFQHVGEQEIHNYELFIGTNNAGDILAEMDLKGTFGYLPRYSEYKFYSDEIHGELVNTLSHWQSSRAFANLPVLNSDFLSSSPQDMDRNFAVSSDDPISVAKWVIAFHHDIDAIRPLDPNGTPKL